MMSVTKFILIVFIVIAIAVTSVLLTWYLTSNGSTSANALSKDNFVNELDQSGNNMVTRSLGDGNIRPSTNNSFTLNFVNQPTDKYVDELFNPPIQIMVKDIGGNIVMDKNITIKIKANQKSNTDSALLGSTSEITVNGLAIFHNFSISIPGIYKLNASILNDTITITSNKFTIRNLPPRFKMIHSKPLIWRKHATYTLLPNDLILITGGTETGNSENGEGQGKGNALDSTEIYDIKTQAFSQGPKMTCPRSGHFAIYLNVVQKVLICGGNSDHDISTNLSTTNRIEWYNPSTNTIEFSSIVLPVDTSSSIIELQDGRVYILTGLKTGSIIYDVLAGNVLNVFGIDNKFTPRLFASLTLLSDGRVLIIGGISLENQPLNTCEVFDPVKNETFILPSLLSMPRYYHTTIKLPNEDLIMILGGYSKSGLMGEILKMEVFNTKTLTFEIANENFQEINSGIISACLVSSGRTLVIGRNAHDSRTDMEYFNKVRIYDYYTRRWEDSTLNMERESSNGLIYNGNKNTCILFNAPIRMTLDAGIEILEFLD